MFVHAEVVVNGRFRGLDGDRRRRVPSFVSTRVPAGGERVHESGHEVCVRNGVVRRGRRRTEELVDGDLERVAVRQHVPRRGHALVLADDVATPRFAAVAGERVRVPAVVDAVELPEFGVLVPGEHAVEGVRDREVVEQLDSAPTEAHVHETLRADRAAVADVRRERTDRRRVGADGDAERRAVGCLRANAQ